MNNASDLVSEVKLCVIVVGSGIRMSCSNIWFYINYGLWEEQTGKESTIIELCKQSQAHTWETMGKTVCFKDPVSCCQQAASLVLQKTQTLKMKTTLKQLKSPSREKQSGGNCQKLSREQHDTWRLCGGSQNAVSFLRSRNGKA